MEAITTKMNLLTANRASAIHNELMKIKDQIKDAVAYFTGDLPFTPQQFRILLSSPISVEARNHLMKLHYLPCENFIELHHNYEGLADEAIIDSVYGIPDATVIARLIHENYQEKASDENIIASLAKLMLDASRAETSFVVTSVEWRGQLPETVKEHLSDSGYVVDERSRFSTFVTIPVEVFYEESGTSKIIYQMINYYRECMKNNMPYTLFEFVVPGKLTQQQIDFFRLRHFDVICGAKECEIRLPKNYRVILDAMVKANQPVDIFDGAAMAQQLHEAFSFSDPASIEQMLNTAAKFQNERRAIRSGHSDDISTSQMYHVKLEGAVILSEDTTSLNADDFHPGIALPFYIKTYLENHGWTVMTTVPFDKVNYPLAPHIGIATFTKLAPC